MLSFSKEIVASYKIEGKDNNKLKKELPFSIGNSICGYPVLRPRSRIRYADNYWWNQNGCFDNLIKTDNGENFTTREEFDDREKIPIPEETIQRINERIDLLVEGFYMET